MAQKVSTDSLFPVRFETCIYPGGRGLWEYDGIIPSANEPPKRLLLHAISSVKYQGHYIVGKWRHRKFHRSFATDLTRLLYFFTFSLQDFPCRWLAVSLHRVSNWLVSQTGAFLCTEIPHTHACALTTGAERVFLRTWTRQSAWVGAAVPVACY